MSGERVLVVEDEEDIAELLRFNLEAAGFRVDVARGGEQALEAVTAEVPDLIVLDLMLPTMNGFEVCRRVRQKPSAANVAIVMVTALGEEADVVKGLELGADDYVTKPFSPAVVVARVRSILRRRRGSAIVDEKTQLQIGDLIIHPGRHLVTVAGNEVVLTNTEFRVLHFLARRRGWVFTRYQIVEGVRGDNYPVTERSVDVQIVGLRRKLGAFADIIETVRGVGYRLREIE